MSQFLNLLRELAMLTLLPVSLTLDSSSLGILLVFPLEYIETLDFIYGSYLFTVSLEPKLVGFFVGDEVMVDFWMGYYCLIDG